VTTTERIEAVEALVIGLACADERNSTRPLTPEEADEILWVIASLCQQLAEKDAALARLEAELTKKRADWAEMVSVATQLEADLAAKQQACKAVIADWRLDATSTRVSNPLYALGRERAANELEHALSAYQQQHHPTQEK